MKHSAYAAIVFLFAGLLPLRVLAGDTPNDDPPADTTPGMLDSVDQIAKSLGVPSLVLGGTYAQGTFKMYNSTQRAELTDNGRTAPILDFVTPEHVLYSFPMKYGKGVWGFNFTGSFGQVNTRYQTVPGGSVVVGQNIGSSVSGDYLAAAPFLYLRLGPILPGTDTYWMFGYGLGGALWHFSGNPVLYSYQPNGTLLATSMPIGSSSKLYLYQTWRWQFHFGHWDIRFEGRMLDHHKINGYTTSYENYGLGVAYTIRF